MDTSARQVKAARAADHWPPDRGPVFVVPLILAIAQIVPTHFASQGQHERTPLDELGIGLLLAGPAAMLFRRRYPVPVLAVAMAAMVVYYLRGYPYGPVFLALIGAFLNAIVRGHRIAAWITAGTGYAAYHLLAPFVDSADQPTLASSSGVAVALLLVLAAAELVRVRAERAAEAAHARQEASRRRASDERLRLARELHDVIAHNISLINVQAGVALHLMDEQPEQARTALAAIKEASRETLREVRSTLGVLRQVDEELPRAPAPGLARLDDLVSRAAATGLDVRTRVEGEPRTLPATVDLAAYRIVQEALTNVVRHAGSARAVVRVTYGEEDLTVQVDDDGRGKSTEPSPGAGAGIPGMRERASALGGELAAGPRLGGGFRVLARLPIGDSS